MRTEKRMACIEGEARDSVVKAPENSMSGRKAPRWGLEIVMRCALSFLLAVALAVPASLLQTAVPSWGVQNAPKAYAAVGTDVWSDFFTMQNMSGYPGSISENELTFAKTYGGTKRYPSYEYYGTSVSGDELIDWESKSFFFSQKKIPLKFDWSVSFDISMTNVSNFDSADYDNALAACQVGLSDNNTNLDGPFAVLVASVDFNSAAYPSIDLRTVVMKNGFGNGGLLSNNRIETSVARDPLVYKCTYTYDYRTDVITLDVGNSKRATFSGVSNKLEEASAYLCVGGRLRWKNYEGDPAEDRKPGNIDCKLSFNSVTLDNFAPKITEFQLYDANTNEKIDPNDHVQPNTKVRVVCQVKNTAIAAADANFPESFGVHVKRDASLTNNFEIDSAAAVKVNGEPVAASMTSGDGVPVTLVGNDTVSIEYVGTIGSSLRKDTTVGVVMTDDIFNVPESGSITLLEASNLVEGPGTDDSGLTPGTDYHFTRLPAPNVNGWNNTPVTVSFYAGDYSTFTITPLSSAPVVLLGTSDWVQSEDVDNLPLSYMATSSAGVPSTTASDTMRIDTTAPRLMWNKTSGTLTVDDTAAGRSGGVTSGVWNLYATDASGTPISTVKTFPLTSGKGAATQSVAGLADGYYVAEDAAGNRSAVLQVKNPAAPEAERPEGSPLPAPNSPTVTTDGGGLKHAVYEETITEVIDADNPAFGGSLDASDAKVIANGRWAFKDADGAPLAAVTELLDAAGAAPIASLSTTSPGECVIRQVATDADGSTATVNIHYVFVNPSVPTLTPQGPSDPDDPGSPKVPTGDPVKPPAPPTLNPDGTQTGEVAVTVTEMTRPGTLSAASAASVLTDHYVLGTFSGAAPAVTVDSVADAAGNAVSSIDLASPATYRIGYSVTDAAGNTTKVNLTYVLKDASVPEGGRPEGPSLPDPEPPVVTTDGGGLKHAVYEETVTQVIDAKNSAFGGSLDVSDARAIANGRWVFKDADGAPLAAATELLDATGAAPIASLPTDVPGSCTIRHWAKDTKGNTATANIHYVFVEAKVPTLTPQGPSDPDDPDSPKVPTGDPVAPSGPIAVNEDGTQTAQVDLAVEEKVGEGSIPASEFASLLAEHFAIETFGGEGATVTVDDATDAAGNPVEAIDLQVPATYRIRYTVTDADGNVTKVNFSYTLTDSSDPDVPLAPIPAPPTVVVIPEGGGDPAPLAPRPDTVTADPATGLWHAVVTDTMVVPVRNAKMTAADFAALFQERYRVASAQPDGKLTAGELSIRDEGGNLLQEVDRSVPGRYVVEQTFADSAGNTTTVRLTYEVREESATGALSADGSGEGAGDDRSGGNGSDHPWRSATFLPQTGPFGTLCPLHVLFVVLAAVAALYSAVRLRMEAAARRRLRAEDAWVRDLRFDDPRASAVVAARRGASAAEAVGEDGAPKDAARRWRTLADALVLGAVALMALGLAASPWCPFDMLLALLVAGLCALCAAMIHVSAWNTARTRRRC